MSDVRRAVFPEASGAPAMPGWVAHAVGDAIRPLALREVGGGTRGPDDSPAHALRSERPPPPRASSIPPPGARSVPPPSALGVSAPKAFLEERTHAFAQAALELGAERAAILYAVEGDLLDLAVAIAEVLIGRAIEREPALHAALACAALDAIGRSREVVLHASRASHDAIVEAFGENVVELEGVRVQVRLDPAIDGLGCIVEDGASRVDGRVTERLRAVRRAFEDERRRSLEASE